MHAFLVIGPKPLSQALKTSQLNLNHPDLLLISPSPNTITINQIRQLRHFLSQTPFQADHKAIIIDQAHTLTLPAQHALLKSLEEPPGQTIIILTALNPELLLPTIISRCQIIRLTTKDQRPTDYSALLKPASPAERLIQAKDYSAPRDQALEFCRNFLSFCRANHHLKLLRPTFTALQQLQANVNPRLVLEHLFLQFPLPPTPNLATMVKANI